MLSYPSWENNVPTAGTIYADILGEVVKSFGKSPFFSAGNHPTQWARVEGS